MLRRLVELLRLGKNSLCLWESGCDRALEWNGSTGNGCLDSSRGRVGNETYTTRPSLMLFDSTGMMGLPCSSVTGAILAAHKRQAISMNRELLATCRPTQILAEPLET